MAEKIDMSLDDIIKSNKKTKVGNRPANRKNAGNKRTPGNVGVNKRTSGNGAGPVRNNFNLQNRRQSGPYNRPQQNAGQRQSVGGQRQVPAQQNRAAAGGRWTHDKYDGPALNTNKPGKLSISNLHYRVTDQDLKDLFNEFGKLKSANIFYDKSGRSLGNAQVVFASFQSAVNAKNKYNNILLDGRKMIINLEGEAKLLSPKPVVKTESRLKKPVKRLNNTNRPRNSLNNKNSGKPQQKKGAPRNKKPAPVTQEQLDADLDAYINKQN